MVFDEPQSRNEAILQNLLGADNVLVEPESRIEAILQSILNETAYLEEPQSRMEELLLAVKNDETGWDAEALSRNEAIIIAWLNDEEYTEEPQSRIEELLIAWLASIPKYVLKTVVGKVLSITDAIEAPAEALSVEMLPIQDLHGYANPWPAGGGVNKFDESTVTFGKWVSANGTVSDAAYGCISDKIPATGKTVCSVKYYATRLNTCSVMQYASDDSFIVRDHAAANMTVTLNANTAYIKLQVSCQLTDTMDAIKLAEQKVLLCFSDTTPTSFSPYENSCPITGTDKAEVVRCGKNIFPLPIDIDDSTYTHQYFVNQNPALYDFLALLKKIVGQRVILSAKTTGQTVGAPIGRVTLFSGSSSIFVMNPNVAVTVPDVDFASTTHVVVYGSSTGATVENVQVEIGEQQTAFEPYLSTTLDIEWGAVGKNLVSGLVNGYYQQSNGTFVPNDAYVATDKIRIDSTQSYKASVDGVATAVYVYEWDSDGQYLGRRNVVSTASISPKSDAVEMALAPMTYGSWASGKVQLEKGSSATTFEPYTKTIYGGRLDAVRGVIELTHGVFVTDSTVTAFGGTTSAYFRFDTMARLADYRGQLYCDVLPTSKVDNDVTAGRPSISGYRASSGYAGQNWIYILMPDGMFESISQLNNWIRNSHLQIVYPLAQPIRIPLSPQTLTMLKNNNTIWADANGDITLTYRAKAGD